MSNIKSPFTKEQLLPQEEKLEIVKQKGELYIGLPKETHFQEKRICLTPDAIAAIVANDHRVLIEKGAGEKAGFSDSDYSEAGAELTDDKNKVFGCPIILKVEPPSLDEIELINPKTILITALQLKTRDKVYFEAFSEKFQVLNLSAINLTGAFNKNELSRVTTTKKKGFKISALYESLFW